MKEDKITVKIDRIVYKKLQQIKLDTDSKSVSDVIKSFVEKGQECLRMEQK
jgi:predicted CopG family antitoxin